MNMAVETTIIRHAVMDITNFVVFAIREGIPLRHRFMIAETITNVCKNDVRSNILHISTEYLYLLKTSSSGRKKSIARNETNVSTK